MKNPILLLPDPQTNVTEKEQTDETTMDVTRPLDRHSHVLCLFSTTT